MSMWREKKTGCSTVSKGIAVEEKGEYVSQGREPEEMLL